MTVVSQKADVKPITFCLHQTGKPPTLFTLPIRPEELTKSDTSRQSVAQTLGGGWVDNWGAGLPTIQLSGTTGWGQGNRPEGLAQFQQLFSAVFEEWHKQRKQLIADAKDPEAVRLIFSDKLDDLTLVVAPQSFTLRRSKSSPLLMRYQIALIQIAETLQSDRDALKTLSTDDTKKNAIVESFSSALGKLDELKAWLADKNSWLNKSMATVQGWIKYVKDPLLAFVSFTSTALAKVRDIINPQGGFLGGIPRDLLSLAGNMARAGANIFNTIRSIYVLPLRANAEFGRVAAAYNNLFCLIENGFRTRQFIPNYDSLYGTANCASTAGGAPVSPYDTENPFPALTPIEGPQQQYTPGRPDALNNIVKWDTVITPLTIPEFIQSLNSASAGMVFK